MEHNANTLWLDEEGFGAEAPAALSHPEAPDPLPLVPFDPAALAARHDGWTPERQRGFIEELADCGIVCEAAERVGMSEQSARRLRRRPDAAGFSRAWDQAVPIGATRTGAGSRTSRRRSASTASKGAIGAMTIIVTLTPDEEAKLHGWQECKLAEDSRRRDRYFDRWRRSSVPR